MSDLESRLRNVSVVAEAGAKAKVDELTKQLEAQKAELASAQQAAASAAQDSAQVKSLTANVSDLESRLRNASSIADSTKQAEIARLTSEFEAKFSQMQRKHETETSELAQKTLANVARVEQQAKTYAAELKSAKEQIAKSAIVATNLENSQRELTKVREKLGATEKKLADFLELYGEERKVLEDSRKIADQLDKIKRRYATSMEFDENSVGELTNKIESVLSSDEDPEKMKAMMEGKSKGDTVVDMTNIPVWAYYALGVATAILPRLIAGGGM